MPDNKLQKNQCIPDVVQELIAAEHESASSSERFNHDEVMKELRAKIKDSKNDE